MDDFFDLNLAFDPDASDVVRGATFQVFAVGDTSFTTPLQVFEAHSGVSLSPLMSSSVGVVPQFRVAGDLDEVVVRSGGYVTRLRSMNGRRGPAGKSAYETAVEGGFAGTAEDFATLLALVGTGGGGGEGGNGESPQLRTNAGYVQWKLPSASTWNNLYALADVTGAPGGQGTPGSPGAPGEAPQLRVNAGQIQWKLPSGSTWTDLLATSTLKGDKGDRGDDGLDPIVLGAGDPIPGGTPAGTVIFRLAT